MQVILSNREFKQAMGCWLKAQGFDITKYDIDVKITVGRGENAGTKAEITLTEMGLPIDQMEEVLQLAEIIDVPVEPKETDEEPVPTSGITRPFFGSGE